MAFYGSAPYATIKLLLEIIDWLREQPEHGGDETEICQYFHLTMPQVKEALAYGLDTTFFNPYLLEVPAKATKLRGRYFTVNYSTVFARYGPNPGEHWQYSKHGDKNQGKVFEIIAVLERHSMGSRFYFGWHSKIVVMAEIRRTIRPFTPESKRLNQTTWMPYSQFMGQECGETEVVYRFTPLRKFVEIEMQPGFGRQPMKLVKQTAKERKAKAEGATVTPLKLEKKTRGKAKPKVAAAEAGSIAAAVATEQPAVETNVQTEASTGDSTDE